ncbi:hypothetical protein SAMD00023353_0201340 [Rosellinia necatrix]|uniref:Nephrocystin 3-like N-terminal domain-containing protein n=1 Tax=Rosellinia necatrix TaxID=77044 RepID=A0A1S7UKC1_ROSNE|nr:hypothetical protein SAMD00023353_0201340 [Rosellinia necatrix]
MNDIREGGKERPEWHQDVLTVYERSKNPSSSKSTSRGVDTNKDVKFLRYAINLAELKPVLKWISPLDFRALQNAAQRQPLSGTSSWLFDNLQVRGWSDCRTKTLWCHGIPGAGKTSLATALLQKLQKKHAHANLAVLIAYCSFDDAGTPIHRTTTTSSCQTS